MDERAEYLSIAEVASLLGVHRNTVRNRVKAGRYKAHKVVTPRGETYAILRESLGLPLPDPTNEAAQPVSSPVRHNADNPAQPSQLVSADQQAQADAIVQRLLAPFIAELGTVREELGRVKAARDAQEETIAALRRRAEHAEAARAALVERLAEAEQPPPASPQPLSAAPTPDAAMDTPAAPGAAGGFWARVRRAWGGE